MSPETPTSVLGFTTRTNPAAFDWAMSLMKKARIAARPRAPGAPGGRSNASSAYSAATAFASPALKAFSQSLLWARMAASSAPAATGAASASLASEHTSVTRLAVSQYVVPDRIICFLPSCNARLSSRASSGLHQYHQTEVDARVLLRACVTSRAVSERAQDLFAHSWIQAPVSL